MAIHESVHIHRVHSRGTKKRTIRHPLLQDGYHLVFLLSQRRWRCTNPDCKYAMLIQDFRTSEPIDLLPSRRNNYTEAYFNNIPLEERLKVKYLISDMYAPYLSMVDKFFPNAVSVVDSFHVIQWINHQLEQYLRSLLSKYRKRDREIERKKSEEKGKPIRLPKSPEVHLLEHYKWVLLRNTENIEYHSELVMDKFFHRYMNTYDYEYEFFKIKPCLEAFRDLKELYIDFNNRNAGNPIRANEEIDVIIDTYECCGYKIFEDFAELLKNKRQPIINSFIMVEKVCENETRLSRLSNGPIESINRKIKDLKRNGRGWRNFEHFRNRFLFANRNNPVFNGSDIAKSVTYYK